jgi:parallel beta-helix repeat protein
VQIFSTISAARLQEYKNSPATIALAFKDDILDGVDPISDLQNKTVTGGRLNLYNALLNALEDDPNAVIVNTNTTIPDGTVYEGQNIFVLAGATLTINGTVTFKKDAFNAPSNLFLIGNLAGPATAKLLFKDGSELLVRSGSSTTAYLGTYEFEGNNGQGTSSCIIADKGATVTLATGSTITIKEGGFLASEGGTFAFGDNASISYTSTKPLAISPGSVFQLGSGAKLTFNRAVDLAGMASSPIVFERLGSANWDRIEVKGANSSFAHLWVSGATNGLWLNAPGVTIDQSTFSGNGTAVSMRSAYDGYALTNSTITGSTTRGVLLLTGAEATISGNTISGSTNEGILVQDAGTTATISANTISANAKAGIRLKAGASATLTANTITGTSSSTEGGVSLQDAGTTATLGDGTASGSNTLTGHAGSGLSLVNGASASVQMNTISNNGKHGLYVWDATVGTFKSNTVESNTQSGLFIGGTATVSDPVTLSGDGSNLIRRNGQHEVNLASGSARFYGGNVTSETSCGTQAGQGRNDLYDDTNGYNLPPAYWRLLYSVAKQGAVASLAEAECNYWGESNAGQPYPDPQMSWSGVSGSTAAADYSPFHTSTQTGHPPLAPVVDRSAWQQGQERRLAEVMARLRQAPAQEEAATLLRTLYYLARELERAAQQSGTASAQVREAALLLAWYRGQGRREEISLGTTSEVLEVAVQAALVLSVEELLRSGAEAAALAEAAAIAPQVTHLDLATELKVLEAIAQTHLGQYAAAQAALDAAEGIDPTALLAAYYTAPDYGPVRAYLAEQLADSTAAAGRREAGRGEAVRLLHGVAGPLARTATAGLAVEAYPNPFNPATRIRYVLGVAAQVRLEVYDVLGRVVARLVEGVRRRGCKKRCSMRLICRAGCTCTGSRLGARCRLDASC